MAENTNNKLFTEMFRPKTLAQAVIVPRIMEELKNGLTDHLLFYGKPGSGKTTLTRIMANAVSEPLYINASLERGIDVIRQTVLDYVSSSSLLDGEDQMKVVVLEECDNMTNDAWASLRALMEQCHKTVRFIANCNYIDKVPEPIQSRFNCIPIEPINKEEEDYLFKGYVERAKLILNACHITYTEEVVAAFVRANFPDMRSIVKKIQQLLTRGVGTLTAETLGAAYDCSEILEMIMRPGNPAENYKSLVGNWSNKADDAIIMIGKEFPNYLMSVCPAKINKLPLVSIAIAKYNAQVTTAIDKFIVLLALVYELQMTVNS